MSALHRRQVTISRPANFYNKTRRSGYSVLSFMPCSERNMIISLNSNNRMFSVMETWCSFREVHLINFMHQRIKHPSLTAPWMAHGIKSCNKSPITTFSRNSKRIHTLIPHPRACTLHKTHTSNVTHQSEGHVFQCTFSNAHIFSETTEGTYI